MHFFGFWDSILLFFYQKMFLNILGLLHPCTGMKIMGCPNSSHVVLPWLPWLPSTPALQSCRLTRLPVKSGHSRATYVDLCLDRCLQQTSNAKTMNSDIRHSHIAIPLQGNQPLGGLTNLPFFCKSSSKATFLVHELKAAAVLMRILLGWVVVAGGVLWKFYGVFLASDCSESR